MNAIVGKLLSLLKKLGYWLQEYAIIGYHWVLCQFKVQGKKWGRCSAQKRMEKSYSGLGAEIYALHKQEETEWQRFPAVQQQLRMVEEEEARVFQVDAVIDDIKNDCLTKKEEIKERFAAKRAEIDAAKTE